MISRACKISSTVFRAHDLGIRQAAYATWRYPREAVALIALTRLSVGA